MSLQAQQWRHDGGYRTLTASSAIMPAQTYEQMSTEYKQITAPGYHKSRFASKFKTVQKYCSAPVPWSPPPSPPSTPPAQQKAVPKQGKKENDTQANSSRAIVGAPPKLLDGTNYMFPLEHTTIHVLRQAISVWKEKYHGQTFQFLIFKVDTQTSVKSVIQNVMKAKVGNDLDRCKGWAITEAIEQGDGKWLQGTTVQYESDRATGSLASMGWSAKRGVTLPPVWLTIHRA